MRKFMDYHDTRQLFSGTSASAGSAQPGVLSTTSLSAAGFGRARFIFTLGTPGAGATFSSGIIMCATASGAAYSAITALPSISAASMAAGGLIVVDCPIPVNAAGTAYSWLIVSSASVCVGSWAVQGVVDLYNSYIHPPVSQTPSVIITI
jgi:hypothetical protein